VRTGFSISVGLVLGLSFFLLGHEQKDINARVGFIFISMFFIAVINTSLAMSYATANRGSFYREKSSGMVTPWVYGASILSAELPWILLNCTVFMILHYFLGGLEYDAARFFKHYFILFLTFSFAFSFGFFLSVMVPNASLAQVLISSLNPLFSMFAGFTIVRGQIPDYWIWIHWMDPYRWMLEALIVDQFEGVPYHCGNGELQDGVCPITNGDQVVKRFTLHAGWYGQDVAVVIGFILFLQILSFIGLRFVHHSK